MRRSLSASLGAVGLSIVLGLTAASASPAWADGGVVSVGPEIGSTLTQQPGAASVTFDSAVGDIDAATTVTVIGPDKKHYETSCPVVDGTTISTATMLGAAGTYTVSWKIASNSQRPRILQGSYSFDWDPAASVKIAAGTSTGPFCGIVSTSATSDASASVWSPTASSDNSEDTDASTSTAGAAVTTPEVVPWIVVAILVTTAISAAGALLATRRRRDRK